MTKKDSSGEQQSPVPPNLEIQIPRPDEGATDQAAIAQALIVMPLQASTTMGAYLEKPFNECLSELMLELAKQIKAVNSGDLSSVEGLLMGQAHVLNSIFCKLAQQASGQGHLDNLETLLRLALRAQSQCAKTLETLASIKNPVSAAYIRQVNAARIQQVNNGPQAGPQQLEHTHGEYLDTGATATASTKDPAMATVVEIQRPKDARRQS